MLETFIMQVRRPKGVSGEREMFVSCAATRFHKIFACCTKSERLLVTILQEKILTCFPTDKLSYLITSIKKPVFVTNNYHATRTSCIRIIICKRH